MYTFEIKCDIYKLLCILKLELEMATLFSFFSGDFKTWSDATKKPVQDSSCSKNPDTDTSCSKKRSRIRAKITDPQPLSITLLHFLCTYRIQGWMIPIDMPSVKKGRLIYFSSFPFFLLLFLSYVLYCFFSIQLVWIHICKENKLFPIFYFFYI